MEVQEFVTNMLMELQAGLADAAKKSGKKEFDFDGSIKFDLAVTHTTNKEDGTGKKLKTGIKIVDFEVGNTGKIVAGRQVVQRVQFSVEVWDGKQSGVVNAERP